MEVKFLIQIRTKKEWKCCGMILSTPIKGGRLERKKVLDMFIANISAIESI